MRLLAKFNLMFVAVFGSSLVLAGYGSHVYLKRAARDEVLQQARLMMEAMHSARDYTTKQIKPLLQTAQLHDRLFLPQTVPAYAATESFNYLRQRYPDYAYKEAALNPTNLRDRSVDWEADVINTFRNHPDRKELIGERDTPTGRSLFLARPIAADPPCLECHDRPREAPAAMIRRYGPANGFGWKGGEVVAAQIVSVPMSVPLQMASSAFQMLLVYLAGLFLVTILVLDLLLLFTVVRPVGRLSRMADRISTGRLDEPELPVKGKDEIAVLAASFNRMRLSLTHALRLIEEK